MTLEADFLREMEAAGLGPVVSMTPRADGRLHRYRLHDERAGKRSGWYALHDGALPHGHAGDWRTDQRLDWLPIGRDGRVFDETAWKQEAGRRHQERERGREAAAKKAQALWARLSLAGAGHPYLTRKKIAPGPARVMANNILVLPVRNVATDVLVSLHFISPDGSKRFLIGGRVRAGCCRIGETATARTILCEGFATGMSLHAATGDMVVAAFSAGNLRAVAEALRARTPGLKLTIAADNDAAAPGNPGMTKALEASLMTGFAWIAPPRSGDFNDLFNEYGPEAVALAIDAAADGEARKRLEEMFGPSIEPLEAAYERLAKLEPGLYDKIRSAEAKRLGIRALTLDAEVGRIRRKQRDEAEGRDQKLSGRSIGLHDPEPDEHAQDGLRLVDDLLADLRAHVTLPDAAAVLVVFYVLFAFCYECFSHCPRLSVVAPTKNSGKSTLSDWLAGVLPRAILTENLTLSTLFRIVDQFHAIAIVDEADKLLVARHDGGTELIAALNSGWKRPGLFLRTEGDNHEPRAYSVFAPAVMSGIGDRPPQLTERSHRIVMRRATKAEFKKLKRLRADRIGPQRLLARRCARWARDNEHLLKAAEPELPPSLANRTFVNWLPLAAVADAIGGDWPATLRKIAIAAVADYDDDEIGVMLLHDIRVIFEAEGADQIASATLAEKLAGLEGRVWAEFGRAQKPITVFTTARLLKPFKIFPGDIWILGIGHRKGYTRALFETAWKLYLGGEADEAAGGEKEDEDAPPPQIPPFRLGSREEPLSGKGSEHLSGREGDPPPPDLEGPSKPCATRVPPGSPTEKGVTGGNGRANRRVGRFSHVCDQCASDSGGPDGMALYTYGNRLIHLHGSCLLFWKKHNHEFQTVKSGDLEEKRE